MMISKKTRSVLALCLLLVVAVMLFSGCGRRSEVDNILGGGQNPDGGYGPVSYYNVYSYTYREMIETDIYTYQYVTGAECWMSAWEWDMEDTVSGYDEDYSIFIYEYSYGDEDRYIAYLESIGFTYYTSETFDNGTSYYYRDYENDYSVDIFMYADGEDIAIEITHGRSW